jgi:hypothetical protein
MPVADEDHTPPDVLLVNPVVAPVQTEVAPDIAGTLGTPFIVTVTREKADPQLFVPV